MRDAARVELEAREHAVDDRDVVDVEVRVAQLEGVERFDRREQALGVGVEALRAD